MSTEAQRATPREGSFVIGVVGRTGSGKSRFARFLADRGAEWIEGDRLGHEVTDEDPEVRAALVAEYGPAIYDAAGTLDRARVASRVFADPEARRRLDALVHPRIVARIERRIASLEAEGFRGNVVIDAALLLEWGLERVCDAVVAFTAPVEDRVARLVAARGWSEAEARRRLDAQRDDAAFVAAADVVVFNGNGSTAAFDKMAADTLRDLEHLRAERARAAERR